MKKINLIAPIIILAFGIFVSADIIANAQTGEAGITFPIPELGNCKDKADCKAYCDKKENLTVCVNFGQKQGMISSDEAAKALAFAKQGAGPGNCQSKIECENFCGNQANMETCVNFASQHNLISQEEAAQAQKVVAALKQGTKLPGSCKNMSECNNYCNSTNHMNECLSFAEKSGILPEAELAEAKKVASAMASGAKLPGGCKNKAECQNYCADSSNMEECLNFGEAAGLIPQEELAQAKKFLPLIKSGQMPGGCKAKDECQTYCADTAHADECANFALKNGLMKPEEAEMYKKTGGKGPGGCKGKEECAIYCNDPENSQSCFDFAQEKGLMPAEKIKEIKDGMAQLKSGILNQAPQEIKDCIKSAVGAENYDNLQGGAFMPGEKTGDQIKACFEKMAEIMMKQQGAPGGQGQVPAGMPQGIPDEFKNRKTPPTQEEINKFIEDKKSEMIKNQGSQGQTPPNIPDDYKNQIPEQYKNMIPKGMPQGGIMPAPGQIPSGGPVPAPMPGGAGGPPSAQEIQKMMQGGQVPSQYQNMIPQGMPTPPTNIPSQ